MSRITHNKQRGASCLIYVAQLCTVCTDIKNIQICKYKNTKVLIDNIDKNVFPTINNGEHPALFMLRTKLKLCSGHGYINVKVEE